MEKECDVKKQLRRKPVLEGRKKRGGWGEREKKEGKERKRIREEEMKGKRMKEKGEGEERRMERRYDGNETKIRNMKRTGI